MKPAPTTTALRMPPSTTALMRSISCKLRSVKIPGRSMPGKFGRIGAAPAPESICRTVLRIHGRCQIRAPSAVCSAIDRLDRRSRAHIEPIALLHRCGRHDQQLIAIDDFAADVIGQPQLANETSGPRSNITISASSDNRRARAAADAPPATPPTMTSFMIRRPFVLAATCRAVPRIICRNSARVLLCRPWAVCFALEVSHRTRFQGIFANSIAMPHVSVMPANNSPAPIAADRMVQYG